MPDILVWRKEPASEYKCLRANEFATCLAPMFLSYSLLWIGISCVGCNSCISTSKYNATSKMNPFMDGLQTWYVTHTTKEWNVWPTPTYTLDLNRSSPMFRYDAFVYSEPFWLVCRYSYPDSLLRKVCKAASGGFYNIQTFLLFQQQMSSLSIFDEHKFNEVNGIFETTTIMEASNGHALVNVCVESPPETFPFNVLKTDFSRMFHIWSRQWPIEQSVVEYYTRKLQEAYGAEIKFFQNMDPTLRIERPQDNSKPTIKRAFQGFVCDELNNGWK